MMNIGIITGIDADLPQSTIEKNKIATYPFILEWNPLDDITQLYSLMRNAKDLGITDIPRTSLPSISVFTELFKKSLENHEFVIAIIISSKLSGTYNAAMQAKKKLTHKQQERLFLIDSLSTSGAEGLLVDYACTLATGKNDSLQDIINKIESKKIQTYLMATADDPSWLAKNGRISKIQELVIKNMMKAGFRPILALKDGQIVNKKIQKNSFNKPDALFDQFKEEVLKNPDKTFIAAITHTDCESDANDLKMRIEEELETVTISFVHELSSVTGAHLGPDALLISWMVQ